ncbi:MAG: hypothetical protein FJX11_12545 [Alphaproteobacteria bacterium]|nr:hypothetical protein [Alphaproteobacteria bacterium]
MPNVDRPNVAWPDVVWRSRVLSVGLIVAGIVLALTLLGSACTLDRSGLSPNPVGLAVAPEIACSGDTVGVRWNLTGLPRSADNCRRCATTAGCSAGFTCLDGVCCRDAPLAGGSTCNEGGRCLPVSIEMTLSASDPAISLPALANPLPLRGGVSVPVTATTQFAADGRFGLPLGGIWDRVSVRVPIVPDEPLPVPFAFTCAGGTPGWTSYDFAILGPSTSELIRIDTIRNPTDFDIVLTGGEPVRRSERIPARGATAVFSGAQPRGLWVAFIPTDARVGLPPPICSPTTIMNPLPDIRVDMLVSCRRKR